MTSANQLTLGKIDLDARGYPLAFCFSKIAGFVFPKNVLNSDQAARVWVAGLAQQRLGAGCVADRLFGGFDWFGRRWGVGDFGEVEIVEETVGDVVGFELHELDDFHCGLESGGGGGVRIAQNLSESVARQLAEIGEFVEEQFGAVLPGGEQGAGEHSVVLAPLVDRAAMDPSAFSGGGDGGSCNEGF